MGMRHYENRGSFGHETTEMDGEVNIHCQGGGATVKDNNIHKGDINNYTINLHFHVNSFSREEAEGTVAKILLGVKQMLSTEKEVAVQTEPPVNLNGQSAVDRMIRD
jgi:hypothetical protein